MSTPREKPQTPTRVGIAGLGFGRTVHLPAFRSIEGVEVVALLCVDSARARDTEKSVGIPVLTDLDDFISQGLNALSIAVPPQAVRSIAEAALDRNIAVLCEKPLATTASSARALAARAEGAITATGFEFAETETFRALADLVAAGRLGAVRHAEISWLIRSGAHHRGGWSWKTDAAAHGGVLTLLGAHMLFAVEQLFGPIERLVARSDRRSTKVLATQSTNEPAEDTVHLILEHRSGTVVSVLMGNAAPTHVGQRWLIMGEYGMATLENVASDPIAGFELVARDRTDTVIARVHETHFQGDGRLAPFRRLAQRFVESVRTGRPCRPDFTNGARVQALVEAAHQASECGNWVRPAA